MEKWEKQYHEVGHFLASKGANNKIFSSYEVLAKEIRSLESKLEIALGALYLQDRFKRHQYSNGKVEYIVDENTARLMWEALSDIVD